jgi:hypothetical protein
MFLCPIFPRAHFLNLIQLSSVSSHVLIVFDADKVFLVSGHHPGKAASSSGSAVKSPPVEVIDLLSSSDEEGDTDKSKTAANGKGKAADTDKAKAGDSGKGKAKDDGSSGASGGAKDDKGKGRLKPLPSTSTATSTSTSTSTSTASGMRGMERWVHVDGVRGLVDRPGEVEGLRRGPGGKKGGTRRLHYVMAVDATQRVTDVTR